MDTNEHRNPVLEINVCRELALVGLAKRVGEGMALAGIPKQVREGIIKSENMSGKLSFSFFQNITQIQA